MIKIVAVGKKPFAHWYAPRTSTSTNERLAPTSSPSRPPGVARKKEAAACSSDVQGHLLEELYNDLRDELKEAKEEDNHEDIQRIKQELQAVRNQRHAMIIIPADKN